MGESVDHVPHGFPVRRLVPSGLDYCRAHDGVREQDEDVCDRVSDAVDDPDLRCRTCEGYGTVHDDGDDMTTCTVCHGDGTPPCDLTPLFYEEAPDAEG